MLYNYVSLVLPLLLLTACEKTRGNVLKIAPDTYSVTVDALPPGSGVHVARQLTILLANSTCASKDRVFQKVDSKVVGGKDSYFPDKTVALEFWCLIKTDPRLQIPELVIP